MTPEKWISDLLETRGLSRPDGRMLYGYRLSNHEYSSLRESLKLTTDFGRLDEVARRIRRFSPLFVMYASEWWRREYDGGAWRWSPIIQSFGGNPEELAANIRSECVFSGFAFWGHRPSGDGKKFFGSIVAHGGLPLKFISHGGGKLASIMEHCIRLANRYRWDNLQVSEAISDRANELPDCLQRQEIFELIASMVSSILEIKQEFGLSGVTDPISTLNNNDPNWRLRFPLPVDDESAQSLLSGLVHEASRQLTDSPLATFTAERFIKYLDNGRYQLFSSLMCPLTVEADTLAVLFNLASADNLPRYFNIDAKLQSREPLIDGRQLLGSQVAKVALCLRKRFWSGIEACFEHSLILCGSSGDLRENPLSVPGGGEILLEDPWVFVFRDGKYKLVACGSVRVPEEDALVTIPCGWKMLLAENACAVEEGVCEIDDKVLPLFKVKGDVTLTNGYLKYRVRTRQTIDTPENYLWEGRKFPFPSTPRAIYLGTPKLYRYTSDGERSRVASNELKWFIAGSTNPVNDPSSARGPIDVFLIQDGETIAKFRLVVIDSSAKTIFLSGSTSNCGGILMEGWGNSDIAVVPMDNLSAQVLRSPNGFDLQLSSGITPPESVSLELHWPACIRDVKLTLPFPCSGGRFFDGEGNPLRDREVLTLKNILGARIRIFDRNPQQPKRYEISMTLNGTNLKEKKSVILNRDGSAEIRLIDLQSDIETLMGFSNSLDAVVKVALNANDANVCSILISRYEFYLNSFPEQVSLPTEALKRLNTDRLISVRILAKPITTIDDDTVLLVQELTENVPTGVWHLDDLDPLKSPWLIYPDKDSSVYFRPTVWASFNIHDMEERSVMGKCPLAKAMISEDAEEREHLISGILETMASDFIHPSWKLLDYLSEAFYHIPLSSLDVFRVLSGKPNVVVAMMLRSELSSEKLFGLSKRLRDELGLLWELTSIPMWEEAVKNFWDYWVNILGVEAAVTSFPIVLNERLQGLNNNVPCLKLILDYILYEAINRKSDELSILWQQSARDELAAAKQLWTGSESLGNALLFVAHAQDVDWPSENSFFTTTWQAFVLASDQNSQDVIQSIAKVLFWMQPKDFKFSVANAPILCALWAITGAKQEWWQVPEHRLSLRKLRAFDPIWFEQAFKQAVASGLSLEKLIYPNQLITFNGTK